MKLHAEWLTELERRRNTTELDEYVRWPRTPIGDEIQERIRARVGVSDRETADPRSRPARIAACVVALQQDGLLSERFVALDIACGDALVLTALKNRFPHAACVGIDLNVDRFPAHAEARAAGVVLHRVLIQDLFDQAAPARFDLVLMLNTYRGWESADLPVEERNLPAQADRWLRASARHIILTTTAAQRRAWASDGFHIWDLGPGEDDSRLVCISREAIESVRTAG